MKTALLAAVGVALVVYGLQRPTPEPDPSPAPHSSLGERLITAFRKTNPDKRANARLHARGLARLCRALAERIKYDGDLPKPRLRLGVQFDELRRYAREYEFLGESLGGIYPDLKPALEEHFTSAVGTDAGPVNDERRQKWIGAFTDLADASDYAAEQL